MFKFIALCLMAIVALAAAKPGIIAPVAYSTYSAYSAPLIAASPYTAAYSAPLVASPYVSSAYVASPYAAAYSYPYSSLLLRR